MRFNPDTTFWRWHRPHKWRTQFHKTASISDATCKSQGYLYFWLVISWEVLTTPCQVHLLEWLAELRKTLYLPLLIYYNGYHTGIVKWKRCEGWDMGGTYRTPVPITLPALHLPPTWKLSELHCLGFFMELSYAGLIDKIFGHWQLMNSISISSLLLRGLGGVESSNLLITG